MNIFVSYTLRDGLLSPGLLSGLESLLSEMGTPYIDILHNNSPHPQQYVMKKLNEASLFCACLTPGFLYSEWVRLECMTASQLSLPAIALDCGSLVTNGTRKSLEFSIAPIVVPNALRKSSVEKETTLGKSFETRLEILK